MRITEHFFFAKPLHFECEFDEQTIGDTKFQKKKKIPNIRIGAEIPLCAYKCIQNRTNTKKNQNQNDRNTYQPNRKYLKTHRQNIKILNQ